MREYWVNVYKDFLGITDGPYAYLEYDRKFNAERTATKHRLYRIHVKMKDSSDE